MSVFRPDEFERDAREHPHNQAIHYYKPTDFCFKCARPLDGDDFLIIVNGYNDLPVSDDFSTDSEGTFVNKPQYQVEFWLHVDCAHDLALDLLKDYQAVKDVRDRKEARARLGLPPDPEDDAEL
jgi:hypothetical protein